MKKLLRPQDVLLLGLAGVIDIYRELKDPFGSVGNAYKNVYGWIPRYYKKTAYYQVVYHSLNTGYVEKVIKDGKPFLRLTSKGKEKIQRDFPLIRWQRKKWDGKWRVVIFDIEEKERKQRDWLRMKLRELGFGMIQESVWITPYDIAVDLREFIKSFGLAEKVFVLEASGLLAGDKRALVSRIWPLEKINSEYKVIFSLLTNLHDRVKTSIGEKGEKKKIEEKLREARMMYLEALKEDPFLPQELLPDGWSGEKIRKLLSKGFLS